MKKLIKIDRACLIASILIAVTTSLVAAPALQGRIDMRALTPQDIKDYSLTGKQVASGLSTVGVGQPLYLDALVNIEITPSNIMSVTWSLTNKPSTSTAVLTDSPLGSNVPSFKPADQIISQVAGRALLIPDVAGQYTVVATIVTAGGSGSTNVVQNISAANYMGIQVCAFCHSGGVAAEDKYHPWTGTLHSHAFKDAINGVSTDHFSSRCISCHVVGFDTNALAVNGGFDDIAKQYNWSFPTNISDTNWNAMPAALQNVANVQCENCHGPGSEHAYAFGNTNLPNWPRISVTLAPGSCSQCHDSLPHHYKTAEWKNSLHAIAVEETEAGCSRCHTAQGFANFAAGKSAVAVPYEVITCAACHDPHSATNTHQLRTVADVTLMDMKTVVTEGGTGKVCMQCHISRRNATNYVEITAGSSRFGPHHGPQTDMLVGANAVNYGKDIPSSAHREVVEDSCVTCHMQENEGTPSFTQAGGHTFKMKWDSGTNVFELTETCVQCHGEVDGFDFKRQDYDGNGIVEGIQTEVKGLLSRLAIMLPPVGVPKPNHSPENIAINSSWTKPQLRAGYNYLFVVEDGSYGVHNLSYAVGLLKASIADLSGDSNNDGIADWWQIQYFGSTTNLSAAPKASPAGDGIPNWLKYTLGLNPMVAGIVLPDGVVWANEKNLVNPDNPGDSTLKIYTAAEVVFDTEVGKSYQIQSASEVSGGWQNVDGPIAGTGGSISYVTPTRNNTQMFFRVVHTP